MWRKAIDGRRFWDAVDDQCGGGDDEHDECLKGGMWRNTFFSFISDEALLHLSILQLNWFEFSFSCEKFVSIYTHASCFNF